MLLVVVSFVVWLPGGKLSLLLVLRVLWLDVCCCCCLFAVFTCFCCCCTLFLCGELSIVGVSGLRFSAVA